MCGSAGITANCAECISAMVSGFRMRTPLYSPFSRCAIMKRFMIAHLENGEYNGVRILKPETIALMHSAQFAVIPALPHMCLGFYEQTRNGHRMIGHGGDTQYFH